MCLLKNEVENKFRLESSSVMCTELKDFIRFFMVLFGNKLVFCGMLCLHTFCEYVHTKIRKNYFTMKFKKRIKIINYLFFSFFFIKNSKPYCVSCNKMFKHRFKTKLNKFSFLLKINQQQKKKNER